MSNRERQDRGEITGMLMCGKCGHEKRSEDFPRDKACGWSYWCRACHCAYRKTKAASCEEKIVWVRLDPETHAYMMREMLPASMAKSAGQVARKIIEDAVDAHRHACVALKTPPVPSKRGWPTREQLMGRR